MKKLIAQRPIQYMGRSYERGVAIPAQDPKMVAAWLKAGSAAWTDDTTGTVVDKAVRDAARRSSVNDMVAEAIRNMGVIVEDDTGEFVGAVNIEDQLRVMFGPESFQNEGGKTPAMLTGHLDATDLENWKKADLEKLAAEMGVDISKARNNAERAAILAAVEVQAPAGEDGSIPPEPDAEASEV